MVPNNEPANSLLNPAYKKRLRLTGWDSSSALPCVKTASGAPGGAASLFPVVCDIIGLALSSMYAGLATGIVAQRPMDSTLQTTHGQDAHATISPVLQSALVCPDC